MIGGGAARSGRIRSASEHDGRDTERGGALHHLLRAGLGERIELLQLLDVVRAARPGLRDTQHRLEEPRGLAERLPGVVERRLMGAMLRNVRRGARLHVVGAGYVELEELLVARAEQPLEEHVGVERLHAVE